MWPQETNVCTEGNAIIGPFRPSFHLRLAGDLYVSIAVVSFCSSKVQWKKFELRFCGEEV